MAATDPVALTHVFASDATPANKVNAAQLDAQLALLAAAVDGHSELFKALLRDDGQLRDGLVRARSLHEEVDGLFQLIVQASESGMEVLDTCRLATTANHGLSGLANIDGVTPIAGDRILVKSQTAEAENGIYIAAAGGWARADDADDWDALLDAYVWVDSGTANGTTAWKTSQEDGGELETDPITFALMYRAAASVSTIDPATISTGALDTVTDYLVFHDVSTGALRRVLVSALPYGETDHGELTGLTDDDHPQYHNNARGDARYAPLSHTHNASDVTAGTFAAARLPAMVAATSLLGGAGGATPATAAGDQDKTLYGDGTWRDPLADLVQGFGTGGDGALSNASVLTNPGYYDFSTGVVTGALALPAVSILRFTGNLTISGTLTVAAVPAADRANLETHFDLIMGNDGVDAGAGTSGSGGGGLIGAGGTGFNAGAAGAGGAGMTLPTIERSWLALLRHPLVGGQGGRFSNSIGGLGGGACIMLVDGDVDLTAGTITADGTAGSNSNDDVGGGGAGGFILIVATGTITAGTLNARGGAGGSDISGANVGAGGGGGGRVHLVASAYAGVQTVVVTAGAGGTGGGSSGAAGGAGSTTSETTAAAKVRSLLVGR